jgi:vitamin B12 transporter
LVGCKAQIALAIGVSSLAIAQAAFGAEPKAAASPAASTSIPEEVTITATHLPEAASTAVLPVTFLGRDQLENQPSLRLDEVLGQIPGVSLFRRASSRTAHPTTQGVTLRGFGPNGAGRTLVVLDGVPLNDPFGGWVPWTALSSLSLGEAVVVEGGGAGAWGNQALAGVIELKSQPRGTIWAEGRGGTQSTFEGGAGGVADLGIGDVTVEGGGSRSDGFYLLSPTQRGPIDIRASSDDWHGSMRYSLALDDDTNVHATIDHFEENRVNGLADATNGTKGTDGSLRLVRSNPGGVSFEATGYWKDRSFRSTFASVNTTRTTSSQVLDQYVPATGLGLNGLLRFDVATNTQVEFGVDIRHDQGKTHELFRNLGAGYTRNRLAGGEELLAGGYGEVTTNVKGVTLTASGRVDYWKVYNGEIVESDIATGAITRDDPILNRSGSVANGRLGLRAPIDDENAFTAAGYTGFRVPTINEYFRPFRVGNDITDANPNLKPERLYGINAGFTHDGEYISGSVDVFRLWLDDGVGNVTIGQGPGTFPLVGFVPAGGTLRQRQNIPQTDAKGAEASLTYRPMEALAFTVRYLYTDSSIGKAPAGSPDLQGKAVAGAPKSQGSIAIEGDITDKLHAMADLKFSSGQWDDDQNTRRIGGIVTADFAMQYKVAKGLALTLSGQNIFNEKVVSALSADGLETLANERMIMGGVRFTY